MELLGVGVGVDVLDIVLDDTVKGFCVSPNRACVSTQLFLDESNKTTVLLLSPPTIATFCESDAKEAPFLDTLGANVLL